MNSFDVTGLEIRLFEQRSGRRGVGRSILGSYESINNRASLHRRNSSRTSSGSSGNSFGSNPSASSDVKPPKKSTSRLASTMTMPLGGLVSQPSTSQTTAWKLTIPFTHDERAQLTLTLTHQSEYANWLCKELRARRKEETAASALLSGGSFSPWKPSLLKRLIAYNDDCSTDTDYGNVFDDDHEEDGSDDFYTSDWLCGVCYLFPLSGPS
jgi:hypothetical protein